jgi:hypothetical protein
LFLSTFISTVLVSAGFADPTSCGTNGRDAFPFPEVNEVTAPAQAVEELTLAPIIQGVCGYDAESGRALAKIAEKNTPAQNPQGRCLSGVADAVATWSRNALSLQVAPPYGAHQTTAEVFESALNPASQWFTRVELTSTELVARGMLPPGAIVVYSDPSPTAWSRTGGCGAHYPRTSCFEVARRYGHIEIVGTDRRTGYSDGREPLAAAFRQWATVRVYVPNSRRRNPKAPAPAVSQGPCRLSTS